MVYDRTSKSYQQLECISSVKLSSTGARFLYFSFIGNKFGNINFHQTANKLSHAMLFKKWQQSSLPILTHQLSAKICRILPKLHNMSQEKNFVGALHSVERTIQSGDLQSAAQNLNSLFRVNPNDPRLFVLGSQLALASGNTKGRLDAALRSASLAPNWPVAALLVAQAYLEQESRPEAFTWVEKAVQLARSQDELTVEFLDRAAYVAQGAAVPSAALEWLRLALNIAPNNTQLLYKKALVLISASEFIEAIECLNELLLLSPDNVKLLEARMQAARGCKRFDLMLSDAEHALRLEPGNTTCQFYLTLGRGDTPAAFSPDMVKEIFDIRAHNFDRHLVGSLNYQLPKDVAILIKDWYPNLDCDILDLGCGTGLLGACLGPCKGVLVGVDLSEVMLKLAAQHGVYDKFHAVDVVKALVSTPSEQYDLITALDVFVYIGKIDLLFKDIYRILNQGGRFIFSCELNCTDDHDFCLHSGNRYSHNFSYVERSLKEAGFEITTLEDKNVRFEANTPVKGIFGIALKNSS
jgi:predicted TPR repeat methyltransferase